MGQKKTAFCRKMERKMKKINEIELQELFYRLKQKEEMAYEELYQKYSSLVYQIAFSILKNKENAEDIMQNVFLKIGKLSEDKLPSKYEASWLYCVTKNEAISFLRKNKELLPIKEDMNEVQEDEIEELMQKDAYEKMISSLEQKEKQIVSLKVETGLSFKEIASLLNMPMGTVQWKYYKSLHHIKVWIGNLSLWIVVSILCITKWRLKDRKIEKIEESEKTIEQEEQIEITPDLEIENAKLESAEKSKEEDMRVNTNQECQTEQQQVIENSNIERQDRTEQGIVSCIIFTILIIVSIMVIRRRKRK